MVCFWSGFYLDRNHNVYSLWTLLDIVMLQPDYGEEVRRCAEEVIKREFHSYVYFLKLSYNIAGFACDDTRLEQETNMFQREALDHLLEEGYIILHKSSNYCRYTVTPKGLILLDMLAPYFVDVLTEITSELEEKVEIREHFASPDHMIYEYGGEIIDRGLESYVTALRRASEKNGFTSDRLMNNVRDLFEKMAIVNLVKDGFLDFTKHDGGYRYTISSSGEKLLTILEPHFV